MLISLESALVDGFGNALVDSGGNALVALSIINQFEFAPSNGEFVLAAFERVHVFAPSIRAEHMLSAKRELNFMFAEWSNRGVNLWEMARTQSLLTQGAATYSVLANTIMMLDVSVVRNLGTPSESRRYLLPLSHSEYMTYSNQQLQGEPLVYWFDRTIAPSVTLWPVPDGAGPYTLDWMGYTQIQDANLANGETPNTPQRWYDAIIAGLAHRLARVYAPQLEARREHDAERAWTFAATQDVENVSLKMHIGGYTPATRYLG